MSAKPPTTGTEKGNKVMMWCVPRSISSAFVKCLSAISHTEVWFEPYTFSNLGRIEYKHHTNEDIPTEYDGNEKAFQKAATLLEIMAHTKFEPERLPYASVKRGLEMSASKNVIAKDMGSALTENYYQFIPDGFKHTFLIRHPLRYILSYRKAVYKHFSGLGQLTGEAADEKKYDLERDDKFFPPGCCMKELYDLWQYVRENIDSDPIVIDADDLLTKPAEYLKAYCEAVGLPYSESLLEWDASTDSLKSWKAAGDNLVLDAVNFFGRAMRSSQFSAPSKFPDRDHLTPDVVRCSDRVMKYYEEMYRHKLVLLK
ncbi:uncharacterized protein [Diadema antillarum]|uniref:uncharacterized protein n=1 Tax=Diadema antillarum TaxID=105358 RepID=UPI003A8B939A